MKRDSISHYGSANLGNGLTFAICPGRSILEWDKSEGLPIYEAEFYSGSLLLKSD
jgi:hypothetical protein